jgi:hypothetical protein
MRNKKGKKGIKKRNEYFHVGKVVYQNFTTFSMATLGSVVKSSESLREC